MTTHTARQVLVLTLEGLLAAWRMSLDGIGDAVRKGVLTRDEGADAELALLETIGRVDDLVKDLKGEP